VLPVVFVAVFGHDEQLLQHRPDGLEGRLGRG
jgi:hypothetical protein